MPDRSTPPRAEDEALARVSGLVEFGLELQDENERLRLELDAARTRILELEGLVERDALAPVYNRRGLFRELEKTISHCRRYGEQAVVFYIDLDGFKQINDRHGHAAGDAVLRRVGEALSRTTRLSDTVARIGGDEFVLILRHIGVEVARAKAEVLATLVRELGIEHDGSSLAVTASIGIAAIAVDDTADSVLERADKDMYARKRQG